VTRIKETALRLLEGATTKAFTDRKAHDTFMYGHCRSFAHALHKHIGGEIRALHRDGKELHVYVHKDGHSYDHKGKRSHGSMIMDTQGTLEGAERWKEHQVDHSANEAKTKPNMVAHAERYIQANRHKFK
jgi:hypothetical protein